MNVILIGCGNIGFETAQLLSSQHEMLIVNNVRPDYIKGLVDKKNVTYAIADATNPAEMESVINKFTETHPHIDALICTVGVSDPVTPTDNFEKYKAIFELNFFANLIPIKSIIKRMMEARSGRIVVMSSSSGHIFPRSQTAYAPSKWALDHMCRSLQSELRPYGISLDIVCPTTIKNKYSETFDDRSGIKAEEVAAKIVDIINIPRNATHFIPAWFALTDMIERHTPWVLDKKYGLNPKSSRNRVYKKADIETVLITDATSDIGKELAYAYSKIVKKLYLSGENKELLFEIQRNIRQRSSCEVEIAVIDLSNEKSIKEYARSIETVDLLINDRLSPVIGGISDIPVDVYKRNFDANYFGFVALFSELLKKARPKKVISIIASPSKKSGYSAYASAEAALMAYTGPLRRAYGNDVQVTEVLMSPRSLTLNGNGNGEHPVKYPKPEINRKRKEAAIIADKIHRAEKKGDERVFI
jgi:short-subunit dehydrogenase